MSKTVMFMGEECTIEWQEYAEGGVAMQLWCEEGPMGKATVCVPGSGIAVDEVIIKDYAENQGMLKALVDAGVVSDTGKTVPCGYEVGHVCKLLVTKEV
jgi:hypothetical protein